LADQCSGGWEAGGTRVLRVFRVEANGVREWSLETEGSYHPTHYLEGVDRIKTGEGLRLVLDVPGRLVLVCAELMVEPQPDRTEPIRPWANGPEFSTVGPGSPRPSPAKWTEWLRGLGLPTVWRRYGGDAEPASHIPANYTGWFLQTPERIAQSPAGLFFYHGGPNEDGDLELHLQGYYDEGSQALWAACGRIIGSMSGSVVRCGNCRLTGEQWLEYLGGGGAVYLDRLFLGTCGPSSPRG
jgi:hypothetical protein